MGSFIGVRNGPGQMAFTVMPSSASSSANARVSCTTAPLLVAYGVRFARPTNPSVLARLIMRPLPRSFICGNIARQHNQMPSTLISCTSRNCS